MKPVRLACLVLIFLVSTEAEADAQNLSRIFGNTDGAFVLYDLKTGQTMKRFVTSGSI
ncbi:MAG: hypothetical protein AABN95_19930 [Acidobacteriota bacterium]